MRRISSRQAVWIKLSKREGEEAALIRKMRSMVKKDPAVIKAFKEYGVSLKELDRVSIEFADLDVSAKTKDCRIYLNRSLLNKVDETDLTSYLVHEAIHLAQQTSGQTGGGEAKDYLDKPTEEESFEAQIEFKRDHKGEEEAESYTDELLDYHEYSGKERQDKKKELMGK